MFAIEQTVFIGKICFFDPTSINNPFIELNQGIFMKNALITFIAFLSLAAKAEILKTNSSQFSYQGAQAAFNASRSPTYDELLGRWMVIGLASRSNTRLDGYWPDGKYIEPGSPGYFQELAVYTQSTNAFGWTIVNAEVSKVGYETKKVYRSFHMSGGSTPSGFVFQIPGNNTEGMCAATLECRYFESKAMLLCETTLLPDNRSGCAKTESKADRYVGYLKVP